MRHALWGLGFAAASTLLLAAACSSDGGGGTNAGGAGGSGAAATGGLGGSGGEPGDGSAASGGMGGTGAGSGGLGGTDAGAGSGGSAGSGGAGGSADGGVCGPVSGSGTSCEKSCTKSIAASPQGICEVLDPAVCKLRCEKNLAKHPTCAAEAKAVVDCAASSGCWSCPFDTPQLAGCDAERKAEALCTVCQHTPGESLCSYCGKNNCCNEGKAILQAKDGLAFADCLEMCSGAGGCSSACTSAYPDAAKAADAYKACLATPCPAACNASTTGTDVVREYCKAVISACGGTLTQSQCEQAVRQMGSDCGEYQWKAMECYLTKGIKCDATGAPVAEPTCDAIRDSCPYTGCGGFSSPDGSCGEGCGDWAAKCQAGGVSCECTFGKNLGKKFTLTKACDSGAMELACSS